MWVGEQAPKYDFSKIYIQNYKNKNFLGRVRWVRWVRQLVEALEWEKYYSKILHLACYTYYTYLLRWKWKIIFQNLGKKKICTYLCEPNDQVSCMFHYAVWINILTIFHVKKYTIQNSV